MLDFSPFKLVTEKVIGPDGKEYTLSSATAAAGIAYEAAQIAARRPAGPAEDGRPPEPPAPPNWDGILSAEVVLISACLTDADGDQVPAAVIRRDWPNVARTEMYRWVLAHSPQLSSRTKDSLLRERDMIDRQLAEIEGADPKGSPAPGGASST